MQNGSNSNICKNFIHMSYLFNLDRVYMSPGLFRKAIEVDHEQIYDEFDCITTNVINDLLCMHKLTEIYVCKYPVFVLCVSCNALCCLLYF